MKFQIFQKKLIPLLMSIMIGFVSLLAIAGWGFVDPLNIKWIQSGDPAQQYLGWIFFKDANWSFPIGLNPKYGMDISSSIVYSDSIPIAAIFFKIFSGYLPATFQYFGIWTLLSFILQAGIALKIMEQFSSDWVVQFSGSILFVFAPALLWRVGFHTYAVSHFLILFSLYLSLFKYKKPCVWSWLFLLLLSLGVNFYIFAMVFVLWVAYLCDRLRNSLLEKNQIIWAAITFACIIFWGYLLGYFEIHGSSYISSAYGNSRMNTLAFFNSVNWSYVLPKIPYSFNSDYESYNYIGIGCMGLMAVIAINFKKAAPLVLMNIQIHPFLYLGSAFLLLFAITNKISVGPFDYQLTLPQWLLNYVAILRSSGRMAWPFYYLLLIGLVGLSIKVLPTRVLRLTFLCSVLVQVLDTSAGWISLHQKMINQNGFTLNKRLESPFWGQARNIYKNVIITSEQHSGEIPGDWETFASYAAENLMATNSVYLARIDQEKYQLSRKRLLEQMYSGNYALDSIYIIDEQHLPIVKRHYNEKNDLLFRVDGYYVLAPQWRRCNGCAIPSQVEMIDIFNNINVPNSKYISFAKGSTGVNLLLGVGQRERVGWGWSYPESWGVWSEGNKAKFYLPISPGGRPQDIELVLKAFVNSRWPIQNVEIFIDGAPIKKLKLTSNELNIIPLGFNPSNTFQDFVLLELVFDRAISPSELGVGDDVRPLAVGLVGVQYR